MAGQFDHYQSTCAKSPEALPKDRLVQNRCAGGLFGIVLIAGSGWRIPLGSLQDSRSVREHSHDDDDSKQDYGHSQFMHLLFFGFLHY